MKHTVESVHNQLHLIYDLGAISHLNEECGINMLDGSLKEGDFTNPKFYKDMVYAGLLHRFDEVTEQVIKDETRGIPVALIIKAVQKSISEATGSDSDEETIAAKMEDIAQNAPGNEQEPAATTLEAPADAGQSEPSSRT